MFLSCLNACLNNELLGSVQHLGELLSMMSTRERVSTNTEHFLLSPTALADLADQGDTVCEEVYTFGLTENEQGVYFLPACTYISGCACTASGHLVFFILSF